MKIGAIYPQTELRPDPSTIRTYIQRVEELGYQHILAFDHVLGADPSIHLNWDGPYTVDSPFHEPLVLFGFLAAITSLELVTCIIIAPQRQTALLAKQAAEVDILTQGRFRLGLGVGWNTVEYEALGQDFTTRGQREEEQIGLMRRLWTERTVSHDGRFDQVTAAGLAPLPVQQPIPIWLGGRSKAAFRRIGRLADGWFPRMLPGPDLDEALAIIAESATDADRDPSTLGMEPQVDCGHGDADTLIKHAQEWEEAGATHLALNTMRSGLSDVDAHLEALTKAAIALGIRS